jgi:hypothetical protein
MAPVFPVCDASGPPDVDYICTSILVGYRVHFDR